ncbi:hypothetical protein FA13DRAFT_1729603 [Coprinellus micaceus]|uniref:Uncharacterized protein n=1 Tax=Coprinellus micaceus TaxID=71717 RepID=A0A4Y7TIY4_COPMI|nr:hypothetical protein FA13DRAFT_1729603 [Coprinellus micaceus]
MTRSRRLVTSGLPSRHFKWCRYGKKDSRPPRRLTTQQASRRLCWSGDLLRRRRSFSIDVYGFPVGPCSAMWNRRDPVWKTARDAMWSSFNVQGIWKSTGGAAVA